jgi:hypothetical protein
MTAAARLYAFMGLCVLLALAGCGRGMLQQGERQAWRGQAEAQCMKSGAVKLGAGVVQIKPIEGPGMCGADFPLKVAALGESSARLGYNDIPRPPGGIASSSQMPDWPGEPRYARPQPMPSAPQPPPAAQMRWTPGPPSIGAPEVTPAQPQPRTYQPPPAQTQTYQPLYQSPYNQAPPVYTPPTRPQYQAPQYPAPQYQAPQYQAPQTYDPRGGGRPVSIHPPGVMPRDDIPDDAVLPQRGAMPQRVQPAYNAPSYAPPPQRYTPPALGPMRGPVNGPMSTGAITPAALTPAATLSCPIVSALDRWVAEGVQPAAMRWFGSPVTEIRQISAYSCRSMVGAGTSRISEHAFGNALDIAGFTLADGRKVTVKNGWRGSPEEQGFLHDVQLYACNTFVTVLAPGYNAAHYDHIHVDLMRRKNGRRPCQPAAIPGEVAAAKARTMYAAKHGGQYTGSIGKTAKPGSAPEAVPGADGLDDDDDTTGSIGNSSASTPSAVPGADGDFDDDDTTGSIGAQTGWPRTAPESKTPYRPDRLTSH